MNNRPNPTYTKLEIVHRHQETIKIFESKSDLEIWSAFNASDEMAFNYLFRIYTPQLYKYGCQFQIGEESVQDAIQNLFIYLRMKRGSLSAVSSIKAYLFKSLQYELLKQIKKDKGKTAVNIEDLEVDFPLEVSIESTIINSETKQEQIKKLQESISKLSPRQRQAILLLYEEGLTYADIATIMEFSEVKTARKLIYRALEVLRENMGIEKKKK